MQRNLIEAMTLEILERVENRRCMEDDDFLEFKREWPDAKKVARKIAGHANAARGHPLLWIFGVDEKAGTVPGVSPLEVSDWYNQVKAEFDEAKAPDLDGQVQLLWTNAKGEQVMVVAMRFLTDASPYVVKNPGGGHITFEVPWRQGNSTFSAHRSQLLRLLTPIRQVPSAMLLRAVLSVKHSQGDARFLMGALEWVLDLDLYFTYAGAEPIVIPKWQTLAFFEVKGMMPRTQFSLVEFAKRHRSGAVENGGFELTLRGSGVACLTLTAYTGEASAPSTGQAAELFLEMLPIDAERPVRLEATLPASPSQTPACFNAWAARIAPNGVNLLL